MSYRLNRLFFCFLLLSVAAYAEPLQKTLLHWQVTCNNLNYCVTRNSPAEKGLVMTISRHAGVQDSPQVRIDYGNRFHRNVMSTALKKSLVLDKRPLSFSPKSWRVQPHHLVTRDMTIINAFLRAVLQGKTIQLARSKGAAISLEGLQNALALMDQVQGRNDGMSAWIRRGQRVKEDVPPEPRMPVLSALHPTAVPLSARESHRLMDFVNRHLTADTCSLDPLRRDIRVAPLSNDKAIVLISCERGAYNVIDLAFEVMRHLPHTLRGLVLTLPFTPPDRGSRKLDLVNTRFDPLTGELMTFDKRRGLGDCGSATRWLYNGRDFVLDEYVEERSCDRWHNSDDWPELWQSRRRASEETIASVN